MSQIYSLRIDENELKILQFLSNRMSISKAQLLKNALYEYLDKYSSELPRELQIESKMLKVKRQLKTIKRIRYISYQIQKCEEMIKFYSKMKNENNKSGILKNINVDKMILLEKQLLNELNELMEMMK